MDNMAKETKMIQSLNLKPNLCDYSNAYILVKGDITVSAIAADTNVAFKNCASFTRCVTHINDEHVEAAANLDIILPMYNLLNILITMQILVKVYISLKEMNLQ